MKSGHIILACLLQLSMISAAHSGELNECRSTFYQYDYINSISENLFGGMLSDDKLYVRRGYVFAYDHQHLVPKWAAWHANPAFRDIPERKSRWSSFKSDPELPMVSDNDYKGWYRSEKNYARGHIVPYYISGGDRDNDGKDAEFESNLKIEDMDDACVVFEINSFSNIAPQYHNRFNGSGGVWYKLESQLRTLIDKDNDYQVYAGTIFVPNVPVETIGNRKKDPESWHIGVPHGFFKVIYDNNLQQAIGFLFDHANDLPAGCNISDKQRIQPEQCIVDIETIEEVTGLTFFSTLPDDKRESVISGSTKENWAHWRQK